jgi:hypothetical protein
MGKIENYLSDLENAEDKYLVNWVLPYGSAYSIAYDSYKRTLDSQAAADKRLADFFITAASLGFGAGLGAMFGSAVLKTVVTDAALKVVCDRNMVRTFNVMARISAREPGRYLAGKAWELIEEKLDSKAKGLVRGMFQSLPLPSAPRTPQCFQNDLHQYVLRAKIAAYETAVNVRDSSKFSSAQKDQHADSFYQAPFFNNAPVKKVIPNESAAAEIIELSFYMTMAMNSDVKVTQYFRDDGMLVKSVNNGSYDVLTTDKRYGNVITRSDVLREDHEKRNLTHVHKKPIGVESIHYNRPGDEIISRVNNLYGKLFKGEFAPNGLFNASYGLKEVAKAEAALDALNQKVLQIVP